MFGAWFTAGAVAPLVLLLASNSWRYGSLFDFGYGADATKQSYPIVRGLIGMWASSGKSLFFYAPIAVVAVLGLRRAFRSVPMEMVLLGGLVLANCLFFARVQFWSGDWAWGPRYMQIVLPCLAAMAAPLMASIAWRRALAALTVFGFFISALPAVLIRFSLIFLKAARFMPSGNPLHGPPVWDHSYYALIWHTWHWQPILFQIGLIPHAIGNTFWHAASRPRNPNPPVSARDPRIEFWWLRLHSIGFTAALFFAAWPAIAGVTGLRMLRGARRSQSCPEPDEQPAVAH
jgi:hypothetical protein